MILLIALLGLIIYLSIVMIRSGKNVNYSFSYGFGLSIMAYLLSSFLFFWFAVLRRIAVLNINFSFDSDVAFAVILVPVIAAVPWIPFGIITGLISLKKGNRTALKFLCGFLVLISIGLSILFWKLPYN